jgi:hypothetical protein
MVVVVVLRASSRMKLAGIPILLAELKLFLLL